MLDSLHRDGVEIVSPNFMNVRDYDPRYNFVPTAPSAATPAGADAPVDVVFDKAEEAETLSGLRKNLAGIQKRIEQLKKDAKEAAGDTERQECQAELDRATEQMEQLRVDIAAAEEKEKDRDD